MKKMNDEILFDRHFHADPPVCFRVFGVGEETAELIDTVNAFGYNRVSASVITSPIECVPTDEDKMVIIVARDNEYKANRVAKIFHDAGILTLGLLHDAESDCYDSVVYDAVYTDFADIIKTILHPLISSGFICYDFNDLRTTLDDTKHLLAKSMKVCGKKRIKDAVYSIKKTLAPSMLNAVEHISIFMYFNKDSKHPLMVKELAGLNDLIGELSENIDVIWNVYPDNTLKRSEIAVSVIVTGNFFDTRISTHG